jgi:hypothetical protein
VGVVITLNPGSVSTISDALCHCNSNIFLFQSWSVINTVSRHSTDMLLFQSEEATVAEEEEAAEAISKEEQAVKP